MPQYCLAGMLYLGGEIPGREGLFIIILFYAIECIYNMFIEKILEMILDS